jgi:putative ABC transport system ATP-binding protein
VPEDLFRPFEDAGPSIEELIAPTGQPEPFAVLPEPEIGPPSPPVGLAKADLAAPAFEVGPPEADLDDDFPPPDFPETEFPETDFPARDFPARDFPETDLPETDFPERDFPETDFPATDFAQPVLSPLDFPPLDFPTPAAPPDFPVLPEAEFAVPAAAAPPQDKAAPAAPPGLTFTAPEQSPQAAPTPPPARQPSRRRRPAPPAEPAPARVPALGVTGPVLGEVIAVQEVTKSYPGPYPVQVLRGVNLSIARGALTAIVGPSGSGKSALLHSLAGLEPVTSGTITVDGQVVTTMNERQRLKYRRQSVGLVFDAPAMVAGLSVEANIRLPLDLARLRLDRPWFDTVVAVTGLEDLLAVPPGELSAEQRQRVACARALITRPVVVVADEPTRTLDSAVSAGYLALLRQLVDDLQQTVVVATHDAQVAGVADRAVVMCDGLVVGDITHPGVDQVLDALRPLAVGGV